MTSLLRLSQLVEDERPVIADRTFTGLVLLGPAIIYPFDCTFDECEWTTDFGSTFWPIEADRARVVGALFVERCSFVTCVFNGVGIAAPEIDREQYRSLWP